MWHFLWKKKAVLIFFFFEEVAAKIGCPPLTRSEILRGSKEHRVVTSLRTNSSQTVRTVQRRSKAFTEGKQMVKGVFVPAAATVVMTKTQITECSSTSSTLQPQLLFSVIWLTHEEQDKSSESLEVLCLFLFLFKLHFLFVLHPNNISCLRSNSSLSCISRTKRWGNMTVKHISVI